jgi:hypothetical protein
MTAGVPAVEPAKNPKLKFRLPREDNAIIIPFDDRPPLLDTVMAVLGPHRFQITRDGFKLDGKLVNLKDVLKAANLKPFDER